MTRRMPAYMQEALDRGDMKVFNAASRKGRRIAAENRAKNALAKRHEAEGFAMLEEQARERRAADLLAIQQERRDDLLEDP